MHIRNAVPYFLCMLPTPYSRRGLYIYHMHRLPRFRKPVYFLDKINWRMLYDRRPILEWTCDKLAMKEYAAKVPGVRVPRTFWSGTDIRELEGAELPEHWMLKPNHRSGVVYFGHGRPDVPSLTKITAKWLEPFEADRLGEWAYTKARPLILAEELLGVPGSPPSDYKFFVFAGEVAAVQLDNDRFTAHTRHIYSADWTPLGVTSAGYPLADPQPAPANFDKMVAIASELGRPFDFMRVDLYNIDGDIVFGEITPYVGSGLDSFDPGSFDAELSTKWTLPSLSPETH